MPLPTLLFALAACRDAASDSTTTTTCGGAEAVGWTEASHAKGAADADTVFPADRVNRIDLTICADDFAAMTEELEELVGEGGPPGGPTGGGGGPPGGGGGDPPEFDFAEPSFVPATLSFQGKSWPSVGVRFKGNSSLMASVQAGVQKLPLRIDMDEFEDEVPAIEDQRFFGFKKLSLGPGYADDSLIRQVLADRLMAEAGLPAPRSTLVELWVDVGEGPVYWGLYSLVEDPENAAFLDHYFGEDEGNLYQPENGCADWTCFDEASFSKETNAEAGDWSDVQAAVAALDAGDLDALEATFDVDTFLRWLALSTTIGNWDSYGNMPHNYFLYTTEDGRLTWIPWDHNMSFTDGMMPILDLDLEDATEEWPLIRTLMDDPDTAARYWAIVEEQQAILDADSVMVHAEALHALAAPYAAAEAAPLTQLSSIEAFEASIDEDLRPWMEEREALVDETLNP